MPRYDIFDEEHKEAYSTGRRMATRELVIPVLRHYADGQAHWANDVERALLAAFDWAPDHEMLQHMHADVRTHYERSFSTALSMLHRHGQLRRLRQGEYEITDLGRVMLAGHQHDVLGDGTEVEHEELGPEVIDANGMPIKSAQRSDQPRKGLFSRLFGKG